MSISSATRNTPLSALGFRAVGTRALVGLRRPSLLGIFAGIAALATLALVASWGIDGAASSTTIGLLDEVAILFALVATVHAASRTRDDIRLMWILLALGVALWFAAEVIFDVRLLAIGTDPGSAASDFLYMAFYPLLIAGLVARDRSAKPRGLDLRHIDSVVVALSFAVVAYGIVYDSALTSDAESIGGLARFGYALLNGVLIWTIVYPLYSRLIVWDATRILLTGAVLTMVATGVLFVTVDGHASAAATSLGMTMIGIAALVSPSHNRIQSEIDLSRRTIAPEVVLFTAYAVAAAVVIVHFYKVNPTLVLLSGAAMLVIVIRLISVYSQNERMLVASERRAATDSLTGLSNRQDFRERLDAELARAGRESDNFALLMIDIDNFKSINDIAGHRAGDDVLLEVAETMRRTSRQFDVLCRIGGDELAIIAPHTGEREALHIANRLCRAVNEITVSESSSLPPVSVSVGCCVYPGLASDAHELIDNADDALYRVKQNERGGAALYVPEAPRRIDADWQLSRVRAELAARDADFQAVFRHAREAMSIFDEHGTVLMVNDVATRLLGLGRERIVGRNLSEFVKPDAAAEFRDLLPKLTSAGELDGKVEIEIEATPASEAKLATFAYSTALFAPNRFLVIMWDVTEEVHETAELAESEQRFRALFESSLDPMFVTDNEGIIRDANPAAAELTGHPQKQLVGTRVDELVHPEDIGEVVEQIGELHHLRATRGTFTTRDADDVLRTVEYSAVADFVPGLHLTIVRDITDRVFGPISA